VAVAVEIVRESLDGIPLIKITGDIDHLTGEPLDASVKAALGEAKPILIDLTHCSYIDSGGLAVLFSACRNLPLGGWLGMVGCDKNIRRLFQIVALDSDPAVRLFDDYPDLRENLQVRVG